MTPKLCRAARALLGWTADELAARSGVSVTTLRNFERGARSLMKQNEAALRAALDAGGVTFDLAAGEGPGVRMKEDLEPCPTKSADT